MSIVNPSSNLGENQFMQLLVDQMKYQDPTQPQSNTQFIAQLAQFSTLEEMTQIQQEDSQILSALQLGQAAFGHQLIGANVQIDGGNGTVISGSVSSVKFNNGEPELVVNGTTYPMSALQQVG